MQGADPHVPRLLFGDQKSLSIAKNHPKPSQEFSEQFGPSIHMLEGFGRNSPQKVHPNFTQNLGRQILGNTFSGLNLWIEYEEYWMTGFIPLTAPSLGNSTLFARISVNGEIVL